jgi:hypothetical protein
MDPAGTAWMHIAGDYPTDITILRAETSAVFSDETRARAQTGIYNHHIAFVDVSKRPPEVTRCTTRSGETPGRQSIFMGNPEDVAPTYYRVQEGNLQTGYYLAKGQPVLTTGDLVNYTNETKTVFVRAVFDYLEGKPPGLADTSLQTFRLAECDGRDDYLAMVRITDRNRVPVGFRRRRLQKQHVISCVYSEGVGENMPGTSFISPDSLNFCEYMLSRASQDIPHDQNKFTLASKETKVVKDGYMFYASKSRNLTDHMLSQY